MIQFYRGYVQYTIIAALVAFAGMGMVVPNAHASDGDYVYLQLLGTKGGPSLFWPGRLLESNAIVNDGKITIVDAGYGASYRLIQAGLKLNQINRIFITHLHSDHVLDYPALLMNGWASGLDHRVDVYGPPGIKELTENVWQTFAVDINYRAGGGGEGKKDIRELVHVHEVQPGPIDVTGVGKVTAIAVPHPPFEHGEALAYRFDINGKSLVFTGDLSGFPDGFVDFAKGADVLVSEAYLPDGVMSLSKKINPQDPEKLYKVIAGHHVSPKQVGRIAQAADIRKVVLSHLVPGGDSGLSDAEWRKGVRSTYDGIVVVGRDNQRIDLPDDN